MQGDWAHRSRWPSSQHGTGKLHDAVKGVMESAGMLEKSAALAQTVCVRRVAR